MRGGISRACTAPSLHSCWHTNGARLPSEARLGGERAAHRQGLHLRPSPAFKRFARKVELGAGTRCPSSLTAGRAPAGCREARRSPPPARLSPPPSRGEPAPSRPQSAGQGERRRSALPSPPAPLGTSRALGVRPSTGRGSRRGCPTAPGHRAPRGREAAGSGGGRAW